MMVDAGLLDMFSEALEYPLEGDDYTPLLIGSVLAFFSWLVIPAIILNGYYLSVIRTSYDGQRSPPQFEEWGDLFLTGLVGAIISIVYVFIPTVVFVAIFVLTGGAGVLLGGDAGLASFLGGILIALLVSGVLYLVVWYVLPAALANYARTDSIAAAFSPGQLKTILLNGDYAKAWAIALVIGLLGGVVMGFVNGLFGIVPILGNLVALVITIPISVFIGMAVNHLYGIAVAQAI